MVNLVVVFVEKKLYLICLLCCFVGGFRFYFNLVVLWNLNR